MHWLVQRNFKEAQSDEFFDHLHRFGCNYTAINMYPFVDKFFDENVTSDQIDTVEELIFDNAVNTVVQGAVMVSRVAQERNIIPGGFITDNAELPKYLVGYGKENVLNSDAIVGALKEIKAPSENYFFLKPLGDNKLFNGMTMNKIQFENWRKGIMDLLPGESRLHGQSKIVVATKKKINSEYRFFVVNDKIITYSMYKRGAIVYHSDEMDDDVYNFTETMVNKWTPEKAYVIDVAQTPDGPKIIELNAFGSSGFYKCDKQKIIMAIENLLK